MLLKKTYLIVNSPYIDKKQKFKYYLVKKYDSLNI